MDNEMPPWLEGYMLDPGPGAYDELPAQLRARLKSLIASLHKHWRGNVASHGYFHDLSGTSSLTARFAPKKWALFVLSPEYASAAGLIAAVLPAAIAGVEQILVVCLGEKPSGLPTQLSAALELLGQEDIYSMPDEQAAKLLRYLCEQGGADALSVVMLGSVQEAPQLLQESVLCGISARLLPGRVNIAVDEENLVKDGQFANTELLSWLHPEARIESLARMQELPYHALVTSFSACSHGYMPARALARASLIMTPGQEGFWIWPEIGPEAFYRKLFIVTDSI